MTRATSKVELWIAVSYALFGGLWILLTDKLVAVFSADPSILSRFQTYKGWAFVAASTLLIYYLLRYDRRQKQSNAMELNETQTRLRSVLDNTPIVLISIDRNGIFTLSEGAGLGRTGLKPGQVVGQSAFDLYRSLSIFLPNGETISGDDLLKRVLDGETIIAATELNGVHFENRFAPLLTRDGTVDGLVGVAIDITQRKQFEENLRKSEAQYRTLVEQIPPIVYLTSPNQYLGVTYISPRINTLGFTQEEWVADPQLWFRQIHPDDQKRVWAEIEQLKLHDTEEIRRDNEAIKLEYRLISRDGTERWFLDEVLNVFDDHGELICRQGIMLDITERKQSEEMIVKREARLEEVLNNSLSASYKRNLQTDSYDYISPVFSRISGYTPKEMEAWLNESVAGLIHPEDQSIIEDVIAKSFLGSDKANYEVKYRFKRKDGVYCWLQDQFTVFHDPGGKPIARIGSVADITDRKLAEDELLLHRNRLSEISRQLVKAHETEQRAIGRELHDQIGQMLTVIKITLDMIPQLPIELAARKIDQAREIAADLLTRVSQLSLELRPPMLDDLGLFPAVLWHINKYQDQVGIPVAFNHRAVEGRRFDTEIETTAYRVVQEALTNIARHAQANSIKLEVRLHDGQIEIQIEDNGQGFDPEIALAKNHGLSAMRERVYLVGGRFQVDSAAGMGSRLLIQLPVEKEIV